MWEPEIDEQRYPCPEPESESASRSSHCYALRDIVSLVHAEMDSAWNRDAIQREHVHRWGKMLRVALEPDDLEPVDSTWLGSFASKKSNYQYTVGVVEFSCDAGQWIAYSHGSSHYHKLTEVDTRRDVRSLLRAMRLDA